MPAALVLASAGDQGLKERSRSDGDFPYQVSSVVLASSLLSAFGGLIAACVTSGLKEAFRLCLDSSRLKRCCVPSALFAYASVLRFSALRFVGAEVLTIMEPTLSLALSALAAKALGRREFRQRQIIALLLALLGLLCFLALEVHDRTVGSSDCKTRTHINHQHHATVLPRQRRLFGWACVLASAFLGTCAGLAGERLLKEGGAPGGKGPSFVVLKTQLEVPALFAALASSVILEPLLKTPKSSCEEVTGHLGIFCGWNRWTVAVVLVTVLRSWLAAGIVKYLDNLSYSVSQVIAMLLTFLELELLFRHGEVAEDLTFSPMARVQQRLGTYVAMALVLVSITAFLLSPPTSGSHSCRVSRPPPSSRLTSGALSEPLLGWARPGQGGRHPTYWLPSVPSDRPLPPSSSDLPRWHWLQPLLVDAGRCCQERLRGCGRGGTKLLLLSVYVTADVGKMFLVRWANQDRSVEETFLPSSVILVQLLVSCFMALVITAAQVGSHGVVVAVHPISTLRCVPVAAFFFASKACTVAALGFVNAGTVKLSTQLILPCTAVLSVWMIADRQYSLEQWLSIFTICISTLAFNAIQIGAEASTAAEAPLSAEAEMRQKATAIGLSLCGVVVVANSVGSVVGERFLKGGSAMPLACLKAQLVQAELLVVLTVLAFFEGPRSGRGWFFGWDWRVLICALGWVPSTWMSTIITARFSTVVKNVVQCVSTLLTYFLALAGIGGQQANAPAATPAALIIVLSVVTLALQSKSVADDDAEYDLNAPKQEGRSLSSPPMNDPRFMVASAGRGMPVYISQRPSLRTGMLRRRRNRLRFPSGVDSILDITDMFDSSAPVSRATSGVDPGPTDMALDLEEWERSMTV